MKRGRGRRARRILVWFAAGLLAVQAALVVAIERSWPEVRDPEWAELMARLGRHRATSPRPELVVILGSSRSLSGLDAAWLSRDPEGPLVFNASVPGAGPLMQQAALRRLTADGVRPHRVMLEVLPAFYGRRGATMEEATLQGQRLTAGEVLAAARQAREPGRVLRAWLKARLLPLSVHHAALQRRLLPSPLRSPTDEPTPAQGRDAHGFFPLPADADEERRQARIRFIVAQYQRPLSETEAERSRAETLRGLLRECREQGSEPILFVGPEHAAFRAKLSAPLGASVAGLLADEARRWDVPVFDARDWLPDEEFIDGHHADTAGAARVSRRIESEALRPGRLSRR